MQVLDQSILSIVMLSSPPPITLMFQNGLGIGVRRPSMSSFPGVLAFCALGGGGGGGGGDISKKC